MRVCFVYVLLLLLLRYICSYYWAKKYNLCTCTNKISLFISHAARGVYAIYLKISYICVFHPNITMNENRKRALWQQDLPQYILWKFSKKFKLKMNWLSFEKYFFLVWKQVLCTYSNFMRELHSKRLLCFCARSHP